MKQNFETFEANSEQFESIFGLSLRQFYNFVTGFDIVRFTAVLGIRTLEWESGINDRFGNEGVSMIKTLMAIGE